MAKQHAPPLAGLLSIRFEPWFTLRLTVFGLAALLLVLNYKLWLAETGGMKQVYQLRAEIATLRQENQYRSIQNAALSAEIASLASGVDAIEERARRDLGMIRADETLFRLLPDPDQPELFD